jgi:putative transposase
MRTCGFRVESICRVLTEQGVAVAPVPRLEDRRTLGAHGHRCSADRRAASHDRSPPGGMYGRRKMTTYLRRKGYRVAACRVDRLMRDEGLSGVIRERRHRTTIPGGKNVRRAPDLLDRDFTVEPPNRKWVTEFTYTRTWAGFVDVALVIDCLSRAIVWHESSVKDTTW